MRASSVRERTPELAVDVAEMRLDRLRADEQLGGRFAVGRALGDNDRDLQLLWGELVARVCGAAAGTLATRR